MMQLWAAEQDNLHSSGRSQHVQHIPSSSSKSRAVWCNDTLESLVVVEAHVVQCRTTHLGAVWLPQVCVGRSVLPDTS
jgi:hypothetical protein